MKCVILSLWFSVLALVVIIVMCVTDFYNGKFGNILLNICFVFSGLQMLSSISGYKREKEKTNRRLLIIQGLVSAISVVIATVVLLK